ncbi:MAG: metallophosphoesterase [Fimbriimonadaceae bacterium]|nr:metallophosphoesterase [Fimbriimonadaceae bacterium]QYK56340.1 MAG: metallophosphoesterase [Fimbriimonadaceae bacterium]
MAVLADAHVRDRPSIEMALEACGLALQEQPDLVLIPGDLIAYWKRGVLEMVEEAFAPLAALSGRVLATPGNHDYFAGDAAWLEPTLGRLGIRLLRNECARIDGVNWVGVDSEIAGRAEPYAAIRQCQPEDPIVVAWHEPDMVVRLPRGPELMIAGHSHGGQFIAPWGWAPTGSALGRRYVRGFYKDSPVPLYVSRGIGTTGPPARLFCPAEITLLTLRPGR